MGRRNRVRRPVRRAILQEEHPDAWLIGSCVASIAVDLEGASLPLPVFVQAPLVYATDMVAWKLCESGRLPMERQPDVARYLFAALQEFAVALVSEFDVEHFEAWIAAAKHQDATGG